jgi:hypothetical protein
MKSVVKYVRNQVKLIMKRFKEPIMGKKGFRKMEAKPWFSGTKNCPV